MSRFITIQKFEQETGITVKAVYRKIHDRKPGWLVGEIIKVDPDGRYMVDMLHYEQWVVRSKRTTPAKGPDSAPPPAQ